MLFRDQVLKILLIFFHDFVEQICIQTNLLIERNRPWLSVRLGVVYGDFDLKPPKIHAAEYPFHAGLGSIGRGRPSVNI